MRIWARVLLDAKVKNNVVYNIKGIYNPNHLYNYMTDICEMLKLPVPLVLDKHIRSLMQFGMAKFSPNEFVETFPYDRLVIEVYE